MNEHWFLTLQEAQVEIEAWRRKYNEEATHSPIGDMIPLEFIHNHQSQTQTGQGLTSLAWYNERGKANYSRSEAQHVIFDVIDIP